MYLDTILNRKREEIEAAKGKRPLAEIMRLAEEAPPARDFLKAIKNSSRLPALIAEIKLSSPSAGTLCSREKAGQLPALYAAHGAACLSVVTDHNFFQGDGELLSSARALCSLPLLRKDFILDEYQIYESKCLGADAILLIAAALEPSQLMELSQCAEELGLTRLIEIRSEEEIESALACEVELIGINNRDLKTFSVDLETTVKLRPLIPVSQAVVSESGIHTHADMLRLKQAGVDAILVGEKLVTAQDIRRAIQGLYGEVSA